MMTKTELAIRIAAGLGRESFEHSTEGTFDITALRAVAVERGDLWTVSLGQIVPHIHTNREVCLERVKSLPDESWKSDPVIFLVIERGGETSHLMVDGHHRALRRHQEGLTDVAAYMVPIELAPRPQRGWGRHAAFNWGEKEVVGDKLVPRSEL